MKPNWRKERDSKLSAGSHVSYGNQTEVDEDTPACTPARKRLEVHEREPNDTAPFTACASGTPWSNSTGLIDSTSEETQSEMRVVDGGDDRLKPRSANHLRFKRFFLTRITPEMVRREG